MKSYAVIKQDTIALHPRKEWDNLGKMVCAHRRYDLGDDELPDYSSATDWAAAFTNYIADNEDTGIDKWATDKWGNYYYIDEITDELNERGLKKFNEWIEKNLIYLPLYLYDHGGITMNTTGFSCGWDSGQVGYIYITREKLKKEYGENIRFTRDFTERIEGYLRAEVETYDQYLTGDVWTIWYYPDADHYNDREETEVVGGYYGRDYAEEVAKSEFGADEVFFEDEAPECIYESEKRAA